MAKNILAEAKAKAAAMFVNFSEILKKEAKDQSGEFLGHVWDISAKLGEFYPKAEEIILYRGLIRREYACVPWSKVVSLEDDIIVNLGRDELQFAPTVKEYNFLLKRDVLDQQVVDTFNHKVRRVNDVHLLKVDGELVVAHVDIGLRGLFRRLGFDKAVDLIVRMISKDSSYLKKDDLVAWKYVQPVSMNPASMTMKLAFSEKQLMSIPAADLGEIIFDLSPNQRVAIFRALDVKTKAKVFENLDFEEQKVILKELDKREVAQIVTHMSSDEATDLLERLPSSTVKNLLILIESSRAKKLSMLLGYSSDSAGGLMTTEFVSMTETFLAEAAIEYIKNQSKDIDTVPYIYIVDDKGHLKGATTVRRLLFADPKENVLKTVFPKILRVHLHDGMKEVAYMMDKYKVSAIPVVDEENILHGIITMDDVLSQVISIAWRRRSRADKNM